jgi:hypothetical protein
MARSKFEAGGMDRLLATGEARGLVWEAAREHVGISL